ncbi:MAG: pilus assembly protein PilM [Roseburia sp.]
MKILSIEIGQKYTHVIEADYMVRAPKIYNFFTIPTPDGMLVEAGVHKNDEFKRELRKNLSQRGIKTRKAVITIASNKIASRDVEIPQMKDNRILGMLNANASDYFPIELSKYQLVYRTVKDPALERQKKRKLFVIAVPTNLIHSYEDLAKFCGLDLVALDYVGNSVFQSMQRVVRDGISCTVKVDETSSMITIINHGEVVVQRTVFYGIQDAVAAVEASTLYDPKKYENGRDFLMHNLFIRPRMERHGVESEKASEILKDDVTESFRPLIENMERVLDFFSSRSEGAEVKEVILLGEGAEIQGLADLMRYELNTKVMALTQGRAHVFSASDNFRTPEMITAYGAVLEPMKFVLGGMKEAADAAEKRAKSLLIYKIIFGVLCGVAVIVIAAGAISYGVTKAALNALQAQRDSLDYVQEIHDDYMATQARYDDVSAMYNMTDSCSDQLISVLGKLEESMPTGVSVESLTSDESGITFGFVADNKTQAAKTLEILQDFDEFYYVALDTLKTEDKDEGSVKIKFNAMCLYVNGSEYVEETATAVTDTESGAETTTETENE